MIKTTHITDGVRKILEVSSIYQSLQNLVGGESSRIRHVEENIRPHSHSRILDIGCGPAAILNCLPDSVQYVGYDLNPRYIASAKKRYGSRGTFFCERVGLDLSRKITGSFDRVIASGLLHHLCDEDAESVFSTAWSLLDAGGTLVTLDTVHTVNGHWLSKFITSQDRGQNTRTPEGYLKIAHAKFSHVEGHVTTRLTRIPHYTLYIMRCTK